MMGHMTEESQHEANLALMRRRIAAGQQLIAEATGLTFVRGIDKFSVQAQAIVHQRTHVLTNDRTACGRIPPTDYSTVAAADDLHRLCDTCAMSYGLAAGGV